MMNSLETFDIFYDMTSSEEIIKNNIILSHDYDNLFKGQCNSDNFQIDSNNYMYLALENKIHILNMR